MDDPAIVPSTPPLPPLPETPKLDGPFFVPAKPGAIPEEAPSVEPESPPKKGKPLLVGGLVLFILAGTIISYFALQKGPVWLRMGAQQAYPPTLTPVPPTPTQAVCTPQKTYSGSSGCSQGGSASITLTACVPTGCPATTVSYHEVKITCAGEDYASCEGVCGDSGTNKTLSVPAGGCESVSISCSSPQCGSCQVDFDEYGARRWQHSGCGTAPMSTPIPTVTPGGPSPTPTVPVTAACTAVTVVAGSGVDLDELKTGDVVSFTVTFSGAAEDVAVDLRKEGISVRSFYAGEPKTATWTTPAYTIGSAGSYEVMAFIETNGTWK